MSIDQIDAYLSGVDEPKRSTLQVVRQTIVEIIPDAEQTIYYKVPAFRLDGAVIAGFAAFRDHLSYLPFSGSVLAQLVGDLTGYGTTKSALHFPIDQPLPRTLVERLIAVRRAEVRQRGR